MKNNRTIAENLYFLTASMFAGITGILLINNAQEHTLLAISSFHPTNFKFCGYLHIVLSVLYLALGLTVGKLRGDLCRFPQLVVSCSFLLNCTCWALRVNFVDIEQSQELILRDIHSGLAWQWPVVSLVVNLLLLSYYHSVTSENPSRSESVGG